MLVVYPLPDKGNRDSDEAWEWTVYHCKGVWRCLWLDCRHCSTLLLFFITMPTRGSNARRIKTQYTAMTYLDLNRARQIIDLLPETFDSHDFIFEYLNRYERDYVEWLSEHLAQRTDTGIFMGVNSEIARFLSQNSQALHISTSDTLVESRNIKNNISPNHQWRKQSWNCVTLSLPSPHSHRQ